MKPKKGSLVKICFKNGFVESGTVDTWGDNIIVLENIDSMVVINNPEEIFIYKVFKERAENNPPVSDVYVDKELQPTEYVRDPTMRAMNIYELKKEIEAEERRRAREKLTEFRPTGHGVNTHYGNIDILRDKSIFRDPSEKD